jgi:dsRNA-specific ribonuclease
MYTIAVSLDGITLGSGSGSSKKKAEQEAAENAVTHRNEWETRINLPLKS